MLSIPLKRINRAHKISRFKKYRRALYDIFSVTGKKSVQDMSMNIFGAKRPSAKISCHDPDGATRVYRNT